MPAPIDILPALLLPAALLLALAAFMPFTGRREARRRAAWDRFERLARVRGVPPAAREALARWAHVSCPQTPHHVLARRSDFDRFSRAEVQRLRGLPRPAFAEHLRRLGELRRLLGFGPVAGRTHSSHDLLAGERVRFRDGEDAEPAVLRVRAVDEEGIEVEPVGASRLPSGRGWVTFGRDGEGHYRFRTTPLRRCVLAHGEFLLHEERRLDPRVLLRSDPFWLAVERLPDGAAPDDPEGVEVEVFDVSAGGLGLLADREVRPGSELGLDLPLGQGPEAPVVRGLRARVVVHDAQGGPGRRHHILRCVLIAPAELQRRVLQAFVASRTTPCAPV